MGSVHNVGMWAMPADGKAKSFCRILALGANSIFHATLLALQLFLSNPQHGALVFWTCKRSGMCSGPPSYAVFVKLSLDTWQTEKAKKRQQHGACADSINRNLSLADKVHGLQWKVVRISSIFGILSLLSAQYQANKRTLIDSFQFCILGIPAQPEGTREALCLAFYDYLRTRHPDKALTLTQPQLAWYFFMWHLIS